MVACTRAAANSLVHQILDTHPEAVWYRRGTRFLGANQGRNRDTKNQKAVQ